VAPRNAKWQLGAQVCDDSLSVIVLGGLNRSAQHPGQFIRWGLPAQSLPGSLIELPSHFIELILSDGRKIHALGKYCRSNPLVFSLEPRCQGECGSQK
jgi:hypothetical protein